MRKETEHSIKILDIAQQLHCPIGENGKEVGRLMYDSTKGMIQETIKALRLSPNNRILEIGPGNGTHLNNLFKESIGLRYFGLDISQTMIEVAMEENRIHLDKRKALFQYYDGHTVDYVCHWFDRIMTVNTIYFWKEP